MYCHKCGKEQFSEIAKIGFHEICSICGVDLHVCKNCRHYAPGKPNECNVFDIEPVLDKEKFNFCEEFSVSTKPPECSSSNIKEASKKLGGNEIPQKKDFNSLFDE